MTTMKKKVKSVICIALGFTNLLTLVFCFAFLPSILYKYAIFNLDFNTVTSFYSIDWTIFGVLVAVIGVAIAANKFFGSKKPDCILIVEISSVVSGLIMVCLQLALAPTIIFSGNNKLYYSIVFSILYFVSLIFLHLLITLLLFFLSNVKNVNIKEQ